MYVCIHVLCLYDVRISCFISVPKMTVIVVMEVMKCVGCVRLGEVEVEGVEV